MHDFRFGLSLGGFPEDGSSGNQFIKNIVKYLKETSSHYDSIWIPDHLLSFGKKDAIESMTTITYISALFTARATKGANIGMEYYHPSPIHVHKRSNTIVNKVKSLLLYGPPDPIE